MPGKRNKTSCQMKRPKTDTRTLRAEVQREQAVQLRLAGATYGQIGKQLGCTKQNAYYLVSTALARTRARSDDTVEEMRALDLGRMDALLLGIWQQAATGNLLAIDRVLKILERRAKLCGLDAPTKVAPTTPEGAAAWQPEQAPEDFYQDVLQILAEHGGLHPNGTPPGNGHARDL